MPLAQSAELFSFLKKAHDELQPLSTKLTFDKANLQDRTVISLYGSIIELTGSIIVLLDKRMVSGVPILLRALLEAFVDLVNLTRTSQYAHKLEVSYLKEWLKIFNEAKIGKNEYLTEISEQADLEQTIQKYQKEKSRLESKGIRALKIDEKFKRADLEKLYRSVYNMLCSDSHNNIRSLITRHIQDMDTDYEMVIYKDYSLADSAHYVGTNSEILIKVSEIVHQFFDSPVKEEVDKYRKEFDRLCGGYPVMCQS